MKCIGLTGQAGSGKSTVANIFKQLDIPIIQADEINRQLLLPNNPAYNAIHEYFGDAVLNNDNTLNKKWLREQITNSQQHKQWMENLLHPKIQADIENKIELLKKHPYCIIEIPLLITSNKYPYIDRVILVKSNIQDQINRLVSRDKISIEQANSLIKLQPTINKYLQNCQDIIQNTNDIQDLEGQVKELDQIYRKLS